MVGYIILGTIAVLLIYFIYLYNDIIRKNNLTEQAFGSIDAMLKKRYDLLPNLVETVKQYMVNEAQVFTEVTKLRSQLSAELPNEDKVEIHNEISNKLNSFMISVENYPNLKASRNFLKLQDSWNEAEEQISASRRYYNAAIAEYNNSIQTFPSNLLVFIFGFLPKKVFEIIETERQNINAQDLFGR